MTNLEERFGDDLTVERLNRGLEAYLLWLMGFVMFTGSQGDSVDARYISIAQEIADATGRHQIVPRSWGSAVLAYTYRALCSSCRKTALNANLTGCPLLLQLWSFERFPVGRPWVMQDTPYGPEFYRGTEHELPENGPTFGSIWTRRRVSVLILFNNFVLNLRMLTHFSKRVTASVGTS